MEETTYTVQSWMAKRIRPSTAITFTNGEKVFVVAHTHTTITVIPHRWWMCHLWLIWRNWQNSRMRRGR